MNAKLRSNFKASTCLSARTLGLQRFVANVFRKYLSPFNITDSQITILFLLYKKGAMNQKGISQITILEKSSVNRNLKRLLDRGLISREQFPLLSITPTGIELVEKVIPEWKKAMQEIQQILGEEGVRAIDLLLQKIMNHAK